MKPEEDIKYDSDFIIDIMPNYVQGRRRGYTDEETSLIANEVFEEMQKALEKQVAKKPRYYIDMYNHRRPGCPGCPRNEILYAGQKYCSVCGTKIDWSAEE